MARTRSEQAVWRREQLLNAALTVFADKGVDGATVKDVAQAAGVTPACCTATSTARRRWSRRSCRSEASCPGYGSCAPSRTTPGRPPKC
ncbi:TetR/AcrR family transcriptional regulator [Nonomuraea antimicrobica]